MLHNIEHSSMVFEVALPSDNKQGDIFASASSGGVLRIFDLRRSSSGITILMQNYFYLIDK